MVEKWKQRHGWHQRYFGPRVNCESVPCLPAGAVAWVLSDPRQIPYLMVWKDDRSEKVIEAVRVAAYSEPPGPVPLDWTGWVQVKRTNGSRSLLCTIERLMPRNGGRARFLVCPFCQRTRGALYGWELNPTRLHAAFIARWQCRECARLRYASEGGALAYRPRTGLGRLMAALEDFTRHQRPEPWYPYVFSSPELAAEAGLCTVEVRIINDIARRERDAVLEERPAHTIAASPAALAENTEENSDKLSAAPPENQVAPEALPTPAKTRVAGFVRLRRPRRFWIRPWER